jgi:sigma-E factor negative regulatory protein RseA
MVTPSESLSALMDDEAGGKELELALARMKDDAALRRSWDAYHLLGDALRGHAGADIAARVSRRLADEPTVLAPRAFGYATRRVAGYAASAAASVAAVALVAWTALPLLQPQPPTTDRAGAVAPIVPVAASAPAPESPARAATGELEDYLLAHQPYSHTSAMQGVAPYVRTVAGSDSGERRNP